MSFPAGRNLSGMKKTKKKTRKERGLPRKKKKKDTARAKKNKMNAAVVRWAKYRMEKGNSGLSKVRSRFSPEKRHQTVPYDFLQYHRVVFSWAIKEYPELCRNDLDILLYINPMAAFSRSQFGLYHRVIGMYYQKRFRRFLDGGWIKVFRESNNRQKKLYIVSRKCRALINKMHRISCGDTDISVRGLKGPVDTKSKGYFIDAIREMNKSNKEFRDARL
tara:strand:- start:196 stop:852 length:657 start_codon:yes stop_codon:yes gene_type:complete